MPLAQTCVVTLEQRQHYEATVRKLHPELRRAAERLAGRHRAEDLVQETLVRALAAWQRVDPRESPRAFLHTILRNTFVSDLRRRYRECPLVSEPVDHDRSIDRVLAIDLRRALGELPEPLAQTLWAVDGQGMAYREVAASAGTPIGTVMSRLHRARRRVILKLAA
jgi:RNA polymerase sigma-70 factor (ECF subfamily)